MIDYSDFTDAAKVFRNADELLEAAAEDAVDESGQVVLVNVRRRRARHHVTGKGEKFITLRTSGAGDHHRAVVHAAGRIAPLIAGGTKRHTITPHSAHALALGGGARGFAARVRHPGTPADPFVAKGIDDSRLAIRGITDETADELVGDLAHELGGR